MSRQMGDERARYRRAGPRDYADGVVDWVRGHRIASAVLAAILVLFAWQIATPTRSALLADLAVGDCLYVRTGDEVTGGVDGTPVGAPDLVAAIVASGGAEQAGCSASHGHEVSAIVVLPVPSAALESPADSTSPSPLDRAAIAAIADPACEAAFAGYVGRDPAGSRYLTFPVIPDPAAWLADGGRTVCLVARIDRQWMDHPARNSDE